MSEDKINIKVLKLTNDGKWALILVDGNKYYYAQVDDQNTEIVKTPAGNPFSTSYKKLANRILDDLGKFGYDYHSPESILSWHFTMIDNFSQMEHAEVEDVLDQSFLQKQDWTFIENQDNGDWTKLFGERGERNATIRKWLSNCTHMQMTAACCIGNAYYSINIAFVLARLLENYEGSKLEYKINQLAKFIAENSFYGPVEDIVNDFKTFELYYGIHLEEYGPIIHEEIEEEELAATYIGKQIDVEALVGRNYYLYLDGKKAEAQPFELDLSDLELDWDDDIEDDDDDEDYDDEYNELEDYLPEKCWVKRISAVEDGNEAYYIIAVSVSESGIINDVRLILEEVTRANCSWFMIPGMELQGSSSYEEMDYAPKNVINDLDALIGGRYLKKDFSFIGKKLPEAIMSEGGNGGSDTEYTYALQSAYRLAYMHMAVYTDESGIIESFSYSSYQSSGSGYGDMFSRPVTYSDRKDEAVDMLLYILDRYDEEEYKSLNR